MKPKYRRRSSRSIRPGEMTHPDPVAAAVPSPHKQLLKRKSVEAEYDIPEATLASMASRGGGPPFIKLGCRVYYHRDEIEKWLSGRSQ